MACSLSGQDEWNPVLWLAKCHCVPQDDDDDDDDDDDYSNFN